MQAPTEYLCASLWRALCIVSHQAVPAVLKGKYTQPHLQMGKLRQRGHVTYSKLVHGRAGISPDLTQSHCALTPAFSPSGERKGRREVSGDTCVPYEKAATGQDEKQQLTLRT